MKEALASPSCYLERFPQISLELAPNNGLYGWGQSLRTPAMPVLSEGRDGGKHDKLCQVRLAKSVRAAAKRVGVVQYLGDAGLA